MTNKTLYGISLFLCGIVLVFVTMRCIFLKSNDISVAILATADVTYFVGFLVPIFCTVGKNIKEIAQDCKAYRALVRSYESIQKARELQYKMYFTGTKEEIEYLENIIAECSVLLLNIAEVILKRQYLSKNKLNHIKTMVKETKSILDEEEESV